MPLSFRPRCVDLYTAQSGLDINGDSHIDVVGATLHGGEVLWWENTPTGIYEQCTRFADIQRTTATIVSGPLPVLEDIEYRIYNISGQEILNMDPAPGIYFIKTDEHAVQKLVKIR